MQRLRLKFTREEPVKYISHLDLMRLWERALRRAGLPVARTEGFNPHPRFALAAALAVGVVGEAELMDLFLDGREDPGEVLARLASQLPAGISLVGADEVTLDAPSVQSRVRSAEYSVQVETERPAEEIEMAVDVLLAAAALPRERRRDGRLRAYDLRPLVQGLQVAWCRDGRCYLEMRLRAEGGATGRPEEVAKALGLDGVLAMRRTRLILA
jgi:radical SAM-linked protein